MLTIYYLLQACLWEHAGTWEDGLSEFQDIYQDFSAGPQNYWRGRLQGI